MTPPPSAAVLAFLVLAACAQTTKVEDGLDNGDFIAATDNSCGSETRQGLVGRDSSVLNVAALPDRTRVVYPDVVESSRYEVDRLTIRVDATGTITEVTCG